jgi:membrane protein implicated in regulation of membrane protease activity
MAEMLVRSGVTASMLPSTWYWWAGTVFIVTVLSLYGWFEWQDRRERRRR